MCSKKTNNSVIHPSFSEDNMLSKITMALVITVVSWPYFHVDYFFLTHINRPWTALVNGKQVRMLMFSSAIAYKHKFNTHQTDHWVQKEDPGVWDHPSPSQTYPQAGKASLIYSPESPLCLYNYRKYAKVVDTPNTVALQLTEDKHWGS